MIEGLFVAGTDTNVGKTVLSALLCASLPASYWKPIQTGAREGSDLKQVQCWAGLDCDHLLPEAYVFDEPVSPHLAAERAGQEILLERIAMPATPSVVPVVVEGAGGVRVPINSRHFMTDLIQHLALPTVLAARSTLGTINHTLLSLQCLRSEGIQVLGVVLIGPENCENKKAIERYGKVKVIGQIPVLGTIDRQSLRKTFERYFAREVFQ